MEKDTEESKGDRPLIRESGSFVEMDQSSLVEH